MSGEEWVLTSACDLLLEQGQARELLLALLELPSLRACLGPELLEHVRARAEGRKEDGPGA